MNEQLIRVVIVEDQEDIREGLAMIINFSEGFQCIATFPDGNSAMSGIPDLKPDVVLMDIDIPGSDGIQVIFFLKSVMPATQFMMLTVFEDDEKIFQSLKAGASGYLLKKTSPARLLEAIREVHEGGSPMNSQIASRVVNYFRQKPDSQAEAYNLTRREYEILELISRGYRYKEIGDKLSISMDTVRSHIRNTYEKLQVTSKVEAINKVFRRL
ncbi:MAG TPA: response regulator transcription factor [Bacteroidales bacterium]|nr:response regulator transcription factor [Bacteroidales bacterium]HSA43738.1 response regulator transcription factor [Bacteroidales bacterium]